MQTRYLIIADDFTGSNDTGVQLKRRGTLTDVVFKTDSINRNEKSIVLDTESRGMNSEAAFNHVSGLVKDIDFSRFKYVIKKIDSTLRGNVAEEILAIDRHFESELIIFAPALPDLGRTTENGIHKLNGVPVSETEIGKDPKKPVKVDNLKEILEKVYKEKIIHVSLKTVREEMKFEEGRIFSFDAVNNEDLTRIIVAAEKTEKKILWVGTAAIADRIMHKECRTYPSLCVCGSVSNITNQQIKTAEASGINLVSIGIPDLISGNKTVDEYVDKSVKLLNEGKDVVVMSSASYDREELERSRSYGQRHGISIDKLSDYTQKSLGVIADAILDRTEVSGVFLTGGDTAIGFLNEVHATGAEIQEEIAIGIPMSKIVGGKREGLKMITKAGAFGKADAIVYGMRKLKEI